MENNQKELKKALIEALSGADGWPNLPWDIAEDCETLGLGYIKASKFQRKTSEFLVLEPTAQTFCYIGPLPCQDTGICQTCNGEGQHLRFSIHWQDCQTCNGTGVCPCTHD